MESNNQEDRLLDSMEVEDLDEEMRYVSQPLPSKKASHPWAPLIYSAIYVIISISTVLANHAIFNTGNVFFPYPLTLTWFELALTFVVLTLGSEINAFLPSHRRFNIPEFEFEWQTVKNIFPIGLFHAMVLTSSMYCLKLMNSSLYSITRSSSILFTIVFCIAILKYRLPPVLTIAAFITMFGFAMIQSSQAEFSLGGIIIGTVSSALTAFYFVYLKNSITFLKNDIWKLFQYHTILSIIFLIIPLLLSGEIQEIANNSQWAHDYNVRGYIFLSSILGFLVQTATLNTLKISNPISFMIAVAFKFALQGVLVNLVFHSPLFGLDIFGIVLTLIGGISYGYISLKTPIMF